MNLNILVVDDEKPSRNKIIRFIKKHRPDAVITEAQDGIEAIEKLKSLKPDLVFLDIQMPGMIGFDVIQRMDMANMPPVVYITAFDEYAIQAFEVHAVDYLLKPFDFKRFQVAFNRALDSSVPKGKIRETINLMMEQKDKGPDYLSRLMVKKDERIIIVNTDEIQFIKSQGKYAEIHTQNHCHLIRRSLQSLQEQLDSKIFFRIHRSSIVNINFIKELQAWFHGDYNVILKNDTELKLSRRYSQEILSQMEK